MSRKVINRKNIVISHSFTNLTPAVFERAINLPFTPDTMIVKQVTYKNDLSEDSCYRLWCSGPNETLCSFFDGCSTSLNTIFPVENITINTTWKFIVHVSDTNVIEIGLDGVIFVHLEFLKHED